MSRAIVNVSFTHHYLQGQARLVREFPNEQTVLFSNVLPLYCPPHSEVPYAFKAWALRAAHDIHGHDTLLWCDSSYVKGARPLEDLWRKIEDDGYFIADNGFHNAQWCCDAAYDDLFPDNGIEEAREINRTITHVVAGCFGLSMKHPMGQMIYSEYLRLAQTKAFCGPWWNSACENEWIKELLKTEPAHRQGVCGPPDVNGHRHDQASLSVIAWRLGCKLTQCPEWISYRGNENERTCLVADGNYA